MAKRRKVIASVRYDYLRGNYTLYVAGIIMGVAGQTGPRPGMQWSYETLTSTARKINRAVKMREQGEAPKKIQAAAYVVPNYERTGRDI